jgi:uncharacterized protein (DUF934 family)
MPLIRNGRLVPHGWTLVAEDEAIPRAGDVVLPLLTLIGAGEAVFRRDGRTGVALAGDADLGLIAPRLGELSLVTIAFPSFADGRGFSLAHELRHTWRYSGEIWARGHLIPDQFGSARACGFDAVLVDDAVFRRQGEAGWTRASRDLKLRYQQSHGGYDGAPRSILALRREARRLQAAE